LRPTLPTVHHEILMLAHDAGSSCLYRSWIHIQYCRRHRPRVWDISRVVLYYSAHYSRVVLYYNVHYSRVVLYYNAR
jgi:hypothetical protein